MNNQESQKIIIRFFDTLNLLIGDGKIKNRNEFARHVSADTSNFAKCQKYPSRDLFQVGWLSVLVEEYNVSAHYLITGEGKIFDNAMIAKPLRDSKP